MQHVYEELLRVFNQSRTSAYLAFRDDQIEIAAGERIDLPLLEAGGGPIDLGGPPIELTAGGLSAQAYGLVETVDDADGLRLRAVGPGIVLSQGVAVRLTSGEEVTFLDFGPRLGADAPPPVPAPAEPAEPDEPDEPDDLSGSGGASDPGGRP